MHPLRRSTYKRFFIKSFVTYFYSFNRHRSTSFDVHLIYFFEMLAMDIMVSASIQYMDMMLHISKRLTLRHLLRISKEQQHLLKRNAKNIHNLFVN